MALAARAPDDARRASVAAALLTVKGRYTEAIEWIERGERAGGGEQETEQLAEARRQVLLATGSRKEASASAWASFRQSLLPETLEELLNLVPESAREEWCERAFEFADDRALEPRSWLFLVTGAHERMARLIAGTEDRELSAALDVQRLVYMADAIQDSAPDAAAKAYILSASMLLREGTKKHRAALDLLDAARTCFLAAGHREKWDAVVTELQREHAKKRTFSPICTA